ncbi:MAG: hypothetical protein IKF53_05160 [Clostridia bacterium]|nr:hypothetical protein [Clostridia bacterium]
MSEFKVGFSKVNITPDIPLPLGGYGSEKNRVFDRVLNEIYFTAIAITGENGKTLLLCSYDMSLVRDILYDEFAKRIKEELGIEKEYFHLSSTHTHSSVAIWFKDEKVDKYREDMIKKGIKACKLAIADQKRAEIYVAETKTDRLTFVRHYMREDGNVTTDNYNPGGTTATIVKHLTEPDETMRLIKFKRYNTDDSEAKDVLIINYQVHNHMTGGGKKKDLAADIPGSIRDYVESSHNCLAAYFQGCAGNLNEKSRIPSENRTTNYLEYGRLFAEYINDVYDNMTKMPTGDIIVKREMFPITINRAEEDRLEDAKRVVAYRTEHGVDDECKKLAIECGFHSPYHATAVVIRSAIKEKEYLVPLNVYRIGDIGWTTAPFEVFDQTGVEIRKASPYPFTVTQGYTDGGYSYLPTEIAFEYGCYEADITRNAKGSAEKVRDKLIEMLNEIK